MQSIVLTILKLLMLAGNEHADEIFKKWIDTAMAQIKAGKG
jgi:hypothetical protein